MHKFMKTANIHAQMNIIHFKRGFFEKYEYFFKKVLTRVNKDANIGNVVRNGT